MSDKQPESQNGTLKPGSQGTDRSTDRNGISQPKLAEDWNERIARTASITSMNFPGQLTAEKRDGFGLDAEKKDK